MNTSGFGRGGNCTTHSQGSQTFSILIFDCHLLAQWKCFDWSVNWSVPKTDYIPCYN